LASSEPAPVQQRTNAIALLGYTEPAFGRAVLAPLLNPRQPPEIQLRAVLALGDLGDRQSGELLVEPGHWSHYTSQIREAVISALASSPQTVDILFAAIAGRTIKAPD